MREVLVLILVSVSFASSLCAEEATAPDLGANSSILVPPRLDYVPSTDATQREASESIQALPSFVAPSPIEADGMTVTPLATNGQMIQTWEGDASYGEVAGVYETNQVARLAPEFQVPFNPGASMVAGGNVGGAPNATYYNSDGKDPQPARIDCGLIFVVPSWSNEGFQTLVPPGIAASFPVLGAIDAEQQFDYTPSFNLEYKTEAVDAPGVFFKGTFLNLHGTLDQSAQAGANVAQLNASSDITAYLIAAPEFKLNVFSGENEGWCTFGIGALYAQLQQDFRVALKEGTNASEVNADQFFRGIGIKTELEFFAPLVGSGQIGDQAFPEPPPHRPGVPYRLNAYSRVGGNFAVGEHKKNSSLAVLTGGVDGLDSVTQNNSRYMVALEIEGGLQWKLSRAAGEQYDEVIHHWVVSTAFYGQLWSGAGLLNPTDTSFVPSDLALAGLIVKVGRNW